jgi:RNA 2',3'-cyclic 3'-phosphodiesterase
VRLFVCVRPPDEILDRIEGVVAACRRDAPEGVRWPARSTWHVTLHFLGEVDDPEPVISALAAAPLPATVEAELGPLVVRLGREVVAAPVRGLDALAEAVVGAVGHLGRPPEDRPFRGHVTLARLGRRPARLPACVGTAVAGEWTVGDIALVRSHLGAGPAHYEDLFLRSVGSAHP